MLPGVAGVVVGVREAVDLDELLPHAPLFAVTETVPAPVPMVMVAEVVPCPAVIDQPVPETDQVYEAALATDAMLNVFPVELAQMFDGTVMVPGCTGVTHGFNASKIPALRFDADNVVVAFPVAPAVVFVPHAAPME